VREKKVKQRDRNVKKKVLTVFITACLTSLATSVFASGFGVNNAPQQGNFATMEQQKMSSIVGAPQPTVAKSKAGQPVQSNTAKQPASLGGSPASQEAFAGVLRNMMPLSPQQIKTLRYMFDRSQRAAADYPGTPPRPTSSTVMVNLSPGATPPIVRLRSGFVTSLVFLDSTGQPWPVKAYDLGDPKSFNIMWDQKGNTLLVQAMSTYKSGNLAVMLRGEDTPIMVTLMPGQRAVDYRVDMRVPGMGPNAKPQMSGLPDAANPSLLTFLNGVPPQGAKQVQVHGAPAQAWLYKGQLYLRSQLSVVSPGWLATMSSPDGTHVYEMSKTPVILASYHGSTVQMSIQGL